MNTTVGNIAKTSELTRGRLPRAPSVTLDQFRLPLMEKEIVGSRKEVVAGKISID
jgi:hypothetical protein